MERNEHLAAEISIPILFVVQNWMPDTTILRICTILYFVAMKHFLHLHIYMSEGMWHNNNNNNNNNMQQLIERARQVHLQYMMSFTRQVNDNEQMFRLTNFSSVTAKTATNQPMEEVGIL